MGCGCKEKKAIDEKRNEQLREISGNIIFNDALTSFLYELMQNHLSVGVVEEITRNSINNTEVLFTNGWLAKYANNLAEDLLNAKTNNLKNIFISENEKPEIQLSVNDNKKIIDNLVKSGQIQPEEADEMKKELEELDKIKE